MYKVAIIDDEPLIVEGLSKTMTWEKWDCMVAGYAYDGKEGMELIRKERPDIIITDINMPKMDGLKMIAGLKSEFPDMQLIILTGYREFEYARRAIELGVLRFLLKPSKMNELEYIKENSAQRIRLTDVADSVYVSQWHLSKLLNKHTGKTFSDILNGVRMDKSKELLKDPSLRICDVAEMVGFQDLAHFSRVFKKMEGMSANEYRNTH